MRDLAVGVAAMTVGGLLGFKGNLSVKALTGLWGGLVGLLLGGVLVNAAPSDSFMQSGASWVVGGLCAVVLGTLAYMFYEVAMVVLFASAGFFLGALITVVSGLEWSWLTVLIFALVGAAIGLVSFVYELPKAVVVGATVLCGAAVFTIGAMLMLGVVKLNEVGTGADVERLRNSWAWLVMGGLIGALAAYQQWISRGPVLSDRHNWLPTLVRRK